MSYTLTDNVEELTLLGTADLEGTGNATANIIKGNGGNNLLDGGAGDDSLNGGAGKDQLIGGAGADGYYFDVLDGTRDRIKDMDVADDTIYLDRTVFTGFGADGTIDADAFHLGTTAADAEDRILYDSVTGNVFYDADGDGAGAAVLFAQVNPGTGLSELDFVAYTPVI